MMQQGKVHFAAYVGCKLQDVGLQGIAVVAGWNQQDWKVLVDCRWKLTRPSSGKGRRICASSNQTYKCILYLYRENICLLEYMCIYIYIVTYALSGRCLSKGTTQMLDEASTHRHKSNVFIECSN